MPESSETKIELRDALDIQHAHDTLSAALLGELPLIEIPDNVRQIAHACLDTLCWVLRHSHNNTFEANLRMLRDDIARAGYIERKAPFFFTREKTEGFRD